MPVPKLYVEGKNDVSVISNLLRRYGVDTKQGKEHLDIKDRGAVGSVLEIIPEAVRSNTEQPVGFVIDIDVATEKRWDAVGARLREIGITPPPTCPTNGYVGRLPDYPHSFGVWLMPDCATDGGKLEHLVQTLIPSEDPLWPFARNCVVEASKIVDSLNADVDDESEKHQRFRDVDLVKAELHTWLAWQRKPGAPLGAAINDRILGHDSPEAVRFLGWLRGDCPHDS